MTQNASVREVESCRPRRLRLSPLKDNPALRRVFYGGRSSLDLSWPEGVNVVVDLHDLDRRMAYGRELRLVYNVITMAYLRRALGRNPRDEAKYMFIADEMSYLADLLSDLLHLHKVIP